MLALNTPLSQLVRPLRSHMVVEDRGQEEVRYSGRSVHIPVLTGLVSPLMTMFRATKWKTLLVPAAVGPAP